MHGLQIIIIIIIIEKKKEGANIQKKKEGARKPTCARRDSNVTPAAKGRVRQLRESS
jgi:hypothetical protein